LEFERVVEIFKEDLALAGISMPRPDDPLRDEASI
jgi:hypothetical protein